MTRQDTSKEPVERTFTTRRTGTPGRDDEVSIRRRTRLSCGHTVTHSMAVHRPIALPHPTYRNAVAALLCAMRTTRKTLRSLGFGVLTVLAAASCPTSHSTTPASTMLDTGFGTGGKVSTDFGARTDHGRAAAVQPDGKIVVAAPGSHAGQQLRRRPLPPRRKAGGLAESSASRRSVGRFDIGGQVGQ